MIINKYWKLREEKKLSGATAGSLSLCTFYYGFEEGGGFKEDIIIISLISFPKNISTVKKICGISNIAIKMIAIKFLNHGNCG